MNTKETLHTVNEIMALPAVYVFHKTTPMITRMKKGEWKGTLALAVSLSSEHLYQSNLFQYIFRITPHAISSRLMIMPQHPTNR